MSEALLLRAGWVLPAADAGIIEDGAVLVRDGRVAEVGRHGDLVGRHAGVRCMGSADDALLPGLVNAHHHSHAASHQQQGVTDDVLEPWLLALGRMREVDPRLAVLLSAARQLRAGVTACVDVVSTGGDAAAFAAHVDRVTSAYEESGLRAAVAPGFRERSFIVHGDGEDQRFLQTLAPEERALAEQLLPSPGRLDADDYLALMAERVRALAAHPRVKLWLGPPGPQWTHEATLVRIAQAAESLDTRVQTHVDESFYEKLQGPRDTGKDTVLRLEELGVLSPRFTLAHGVWLSAAEMAALARSGAAVSHNPGSNLRLRAGIAPLVALLEAGVTVALGMDGTTLDDEEDGFAEMRLALRLAGSPRIECRAPTPREMLGLATEGGARLLGMQHELSRLAPGRRADLVLLDTRRLRHPWVAPQADPGDLLVQRARAGDVHTVLVEGEVVLTEGRPTRFDEQAVAAEAAAQLAAAPLPAAALEMAARLGPRLREWYASWPVAETPPWTRYNARE